MARQYEFVTGWRLDAPVTTCWAYLTAPDQSWREWWPALREIEVTRTPGLVGSTADCVWRSPIGHPLRFTLRLRSAVPNQQVQLASTGDLVGHGVIDFAGRSGGTDVTVTWSVDTARRWMLVAAPVLRPLFRWSHHVVMRQGRRGLNRALAELAVSDPR